MSNPLTKSTGSQRIQSGPQYTQPRQKPTMQDYHRASAQAVQENSEMASQGNFCLSSNLDQGSHCGTQTTQWNETPSAYVTHDALSQLQSTGRSLQTITPTESVAPEPQFYSAVSSGCMSAGLDFSSCQALSGTTAAEVPLTGPSTQYPVGTTFNADGYTKYPHHTMSERSLSFLSSSDIDVDVNGPWNSTALYNPQDASAMMENQGPNGKTVFPPSPVSMVSTTCSPPTFASLPAAVMDEATAFGPPTFALQDEFHDPDLVFDPDTFYPLPYDDVSQQERRVPTPHGSAPRPLLSAALLKDQAPEDDSSLASESSEMGSPEPRSNDDRSDPLYKQKPGPDGLYKCPFSDRNECDHKPTPQKCAYDKYLDSHLKPYRCKAKNAPQCAEARFSSTACRLRHEREAHGLHGHGKMPHLCHYDGCDRAAPDNGFPRRWNLFDHMKRVHGWTPPVSENGYDDETPSNSQSRQEKKASSGEKRKKVNKSGSQSMKKSRSSQGAVKSRLQMERERQLLHLKENWDNCFERLQAQQHTLKPGDDLAFERYNAIFNELHTFNVQFKRAQAGQAANAISGFA